MISSVITPHQKAASDTKAKLHRHWWQIAGQSIGFILIAITLLEGYFRLAGVGGGEFLQPDLQLGTMHIPGKQVIWRTEGFSNNRMSSVGLRDDEHAINKAPGIYRIALLGDSVVEALQVDLNDTFGKLLESKLNTSLGEGSQNKNSKIKGYEVINFACAGYSTGQEILQYERQAQKYKPDAIVLLYNRGDSMESVVNNKARKKAEPRPYFYIDQAGQLKEDDSVLAANFDKLKPQPIKDWLRQNSTIYGVLNQTDFLLTLNEPKYRKIKGWFTSIVSWPTKLRRSKSNTTSTQDSILHGTPKNNFYPDQDEMTVTKALIGKLAQHAAKNGQVFTLVIYPNLDKYAVLTDQAKQLKTMADENHFRYIDLSPSFLSDPQPRSNFALYHLNKKGHITVANQLFKLFSGR